MKKEPFGALFSLARLLISKSLQGISLIDFT